MYFFWISLNKLNLNLFWTAAHWFFFFLTTCHAPKTWFKLSRVKSVYRNDLKGNKNYFEFVGGLASHTGVFRGARISSSSSPKNACVGGYGRFGLSSVRVTRGKNYRKWSKFIKEIQGKSILVQVSARLSERAFELSGVDCNFSSVRVIL